MSSPSGPIHSRGFDFIFSLIRCVKRVKTTGIKIETINYWMGLAVPVFLCVAETSTKKLYFAPIKNQVRNHYKKYIKQKNISFSLSTEHILDDDQGLLNFIICYIQEKNYKELTELSRLLLIHLPQYYGFIIENQELDPFFGVEPDDETYHSNQDYYHQLYTLNFPSD